MFRSLISAAALGLLALSQPAAAAGHGCQTVRFPHGAYAHSVSGYANSYRSQCYVLDVRPGQQARLRVLHGNVFFSTNQTQGNFRDVRFYTVDGRLYVYVHTDFGGQQPYTIEFVFV